MINVHYSFCYDDTSRTLVSSEKWALLLKEISSQPIRYLTMCIQEVQEMMKKMFNEHKNVSFLVNGFAI